MLRFPPFLTTLLDKLQQQYKIGYKQNYIAGSLSKREKREPDTGTHARGSPWN